ncbi:MAG: hypothetical protein M2R45_00740 [Verrucomicrobia subdivision 3 bacterium]|nr:hypothetical protein [Limisphaerales bacterium]MCS1413153.1 hypothetical protein [Limisphaerales bacterium]
MKTLSIVTAGHSHTFTLAGYPVRGNPIFDKGIHNDKASHPKSAPAKDLLGLPFTTLEYANSGGYTGPMIHKTDLEFSHDGQHFSMEDDGPESKNSKWKSSRSPWATKPTTMKMFPLCDRPRSISLPWHVQTKTTSTYHEIGHRTTEGQSMIRNYSSVFLISPNIWPPYSSCFQIPAYWPS